MRSVTSSVARFARRSWISLRRASAFVCSWGVGVRNGVRERGGGLTKESLKPSVTTPWIQSSSGNSWTHLAAKALSLAPTGSAASEGGGGGSRLLGGRLGGLLLLLSTSALTCLVATPVACSSSTTATVVGTTSGGLALA